MDIVSKTGESNEEVMDIIDLKMKELKIEVFKAISSTRKKEQR